MSYLHVSSQKCTEDPYIFTCSTIQYYKIFGGTLIYDVANNICSESRTIFNYKQQAPLN